MDLLWKLEPATAAKHRLYRRYLDAWWPILLQRRKDGHLPSRVTYVDAFAGPGEYVDGEDGSPVIALDRLLNHAAVERMHLSRDRVCLIFIEANRARYEHLRALIVRKFGPLEHLPVRVEVRHGVASDCIEILGECDAWGSPILAIFDSWGNVNVPLSTVSRIARNRSSEVITTFGPNWFSRRREIDQGAFDSVFGGRQYWEEADRDSRPDERWRRWLSTYRDAMGRAGFEYRLHFQVVPRTGQPLYLVYGTNHEKGVEVMKDAMWDVDSSDGMSFRDPRTRGAPAPGQTYLWGADSLPELHELVTQRLDEGPLTLEALQRWLLLETARWRKKDAKVAVQQMRDEGLVIVEPTGRITSNSTIRLR
ncbi:three-Cys-motif partner protein TcmP [Thermomonospora amylolytica]|uniref:three-Cys-motif partner protein TcmP n=1 Tax=Thermomonospora amylolytica TaxID=1411117 RepID=UPI000E6CE251|nr:three-Cys-motif partner protein TcmP [Thermomonospora amylolytica]